MHQGLPVSVSIESVGWGSSELEFGASVNSTTLVGLYVVHFRIPGSRSDLLFRNVDLGFENIPVWFLE